MYQETQALFSVLNISRSTEPERYFFIVLCLEMLIDSAWERNNSDSNVRPQGEYVAAGTEETL